MGLLCVFAEVILSLQPLLSLLYQSAVKLTWLDLSSEYKLPVNVCYGNASKNTNSSYTCKDFSDI